jgi:hypothetical protein
VGYDATNYLRVGTRRSAVSGVLAELGYRRFPSEQGVHAFWMEPIGPEHIAGIVAIIRETNGRVAVHTHTTVWASAADTELHNKTIRELKRRFGGGFSSDDGPNAYIKTGVPDRRGAEAACFKAFSTFENNLSKVRIIADQITVTPTVPWDRVGLPELDPALALNYLLLGYLASIVEEYFKATFVGLLTHSKGKAAVFKKARQLSAEDLAAVSQGETTVEEAIARWMSFQNLDRIVAAFRDIDSSLDLSAPLKRPYHHRRVTLYESIGDCLARRHGFVHRLEMAGPYDDEARSSDFSDVETGTRRVYDYLISAYGWHSYEF